jgi:hypothetical protein
MNYDEIIQTLYDVEISTNKIEDTFIKKQIVNVSIGLLEKGTNKSSQSFLFKTRDEACKFLDWVNTNHPEFTYNWGEYKKLVITPCSTEDRKIQPDWYLINDCEIKYAYSKYKSIYNNGE